MDADIYVAVRAADPPGLLASLLVAAQHASKCNVAESTYVEDTKIRDRHGAIRRIEFFRRK